MKRLIAVLDTRAGVRALWWAIGALLVAGFFVFLLVGANHPKDPTLAAREQVPGFAGATFTVEHGTATERFCSLLAANEIQRQTGMTGRHDLGGYDAMVFAWPAAVSPSNTFFHNKGVPISLSIAWFDSGGRFISGTVMDPCTAASVAACPHFTPPRAWQYAVEVPKGDLPRLGIAEGAVLRVGTSVC